LVHIAQQQAGETDEWTKLVCWTLVEHWMIPKIGNGRWISDSKCDSIAKQLQLWLLASRSRSPDAFQLFEAISTEPGGWYLALRAAAADFHGGCTSAT
jgi:hypothetical protein